MQAAVAVSSALFGQAPQLLELGQSQVHQREQMKWVRAAYHLDSQSLRLDVLDHAKEEIRSHYDTYVGRIDTLLLVLALIWPFGLNTIQFSDPFLPMTEAVCPDCVEAEHWGLVAFWVTLIAIVLILPFWGILMLIRCKLKLDGWLEYSLAGLHEKRRRIIIAGVPATPKRPARTISSMSTATSKEEVLEQQDDDTPQVVSELVNCVLEHQEYLQRMWAAECGWLVRASMMLLWMSAFAALLLTSVSLWIFLVNKRGWHEYCSTWFGVLILGGMLGPALYLAYQRSWPSVERPQREVSPGFTDTEEDELGPVPELLSTSSGGILAPTTRQKRSSQQLRKAASSPELCSEAASPSAQGSPVARSSGSSPVVVPAPPRRGAAQAAVWSSTGTAKRRHSFGLCSRRALPTVCEEPLLPKPDFGQN
mmetsp:Transcript_53696/g.148927  ORF Transcript_53696/g.148927 Transcript_53696/m.148927 type:complete len:422 (-) Transcript_53696:150-1415(-)